MVPGRCGETGEAASLPVLHLLPPGAGFAGDTAGHHPCGLFPSQLGWLFLLGCLLACFLEWGLDQCRPRAQGVSAMHGELRGCGAD